MKLLRLSLFGLMLLVQGCPVSPFDRTAQFQAKARQGQLLVRALEVFRKKTGQYPAKLEELVPKYLPEIPWDPKDAKTFGGWSYYTTTNGIGTVSYALSYFMGKGGVTYRNPNWIGDDDGHEIVLSVSP